MYSYRFGRITNHFSDIELDPESEKSVHVRGTCGLRMLRREPLGSCYPIWESLIAAAIQFGNEFPQSTFHSSCYPIWQQVPTVYFSRTNQEVCSHAHLCFDFSASHCSNPPSELFSQVFFVNIHYM